MESLARAIHTRLAGIVVLSIVMLAIAFPALIEGTVAPNHKADLLVRAKGKQAFRGGGVVNRSGNRQTVRVRQWSNLKSRLWVRVENPGSVPDSYRMRGPDGRGGFKIRYFHGGKNFTGAFKRGSLVTPLVGVGEMLTPDFQLRARVKRNVRPGKTLSVRIRGASTGAPVGDGTDIVRALLVAP